MQCHCSIEHFFFIALEFFEHLQQCQKNKTKHGCQDHLFQLNCWNVPDRCFLKNSTMLPELATYLQLADRSDQWLLFWCCRPNRTLKSAHGSPAFVCSGLDSLVFVFKNPPNHSWSTGTICPGCCWTHPASASPCSITLAVCRPGQGG